MRLVRTSMGYQAVAPEPKKMCAAECGAEVDMPGDYCLACAERHEDIVAFDRPVYYFGRGGR